MCYNQYLSCRVSQPDCFSRSLFIPTASPTSDDYRQLICYDKYVCCLDCDCVNDQTDTHMLTVYHCICCMFTSIVNLFLSIYRNRPVCRTPDWVNMFIALTSKLGDVLLESFLYIWNTSDTSFSGNMWSKMSLYLLQNLKNTSQVYFLWRLQCL